MYFKIKSIQHSLMSISKICLFRTFISSDKLKMPYSVRFRKRFNIEITNTGKLEIGNHVFFNNDVSINVLESVKIGDYTMVGENVKIYDHDHEFKLGEKPFALQGFKTQGITIGKNVWIGADCLILKGVTIGDDCVIAGGSTVVKDIPSGTIYYNEISARLKELN